MKSADNGWKRLWSVVSDQSARSIREKADYTLFFIGIGVEYVLLMAVIFEHAGHSEQTMKVVDLFVLAALFIALLIHQFLIFRNYSLHCSLSKGKCSKHELWICLLFGVLTGEVGYLYVLAKCNFPGVPIVKPILSVLDGLLGPAPNDEGLVIWDYSALGGALKGVFALGAILLSASILLWDWRAADSFRQLSDEMPTDGESSPNPDNVIRKESYGKAIGFFYTMDGIASLVWLAVLGTVLPDDRLGIKASSWATLLNYMALGYFIVAVIRLRAAAGTLAKLTTRRDIHQTVI